MTDKQCHGGVSEEFGRGYDRGVATMAARKQIKKPKVKKPKKPGYLWINRIRARRRAKAMEYYGSPDAAINIRFP